MESDSGKRAKDSGVRDRRYSIRYPFAADAEMLELESGSRANGDLRSFARRMFRVCALRPRVPRPCPRNAMHGNKKVRMLAVVRVVIPKVGMGVEFLDI